MEAALAHPELAMRQIIAAVDAHPSLNEMGRQWLTIMSGGRSILALSLPDRHPRVAVKPTPLLRTAMVLHLDLALYR